VADKGEALGPFEFIILFFSFIYTLALTHLLLAAARMIRRRRSLVFSWPHALWMMNALLLLMSLPVILGGFALVGAMYLICALIAPDFEDRDDLDLRASMNARAEPTFWRLQRSCRWLSS
jgi:hypothetical protein